jgi:hypothetical protein
LEPDAQRIEIVDAPIVGGTWRDHDEKNAKHFPHLAPPQSPRTELRWFVYITKPE